MEKTLADVRGEIPLRRAGFAPKLSDAEVLTMEFAGEYFGLPNDKAIWHYFQQHWRDWFPQLGVAHDLCATSCQSVGGVKWRLQRYWADRLGYAQQAVHIMDGLPLPACHFRRAHFSQVFWGKAMYGHCAPKAQTYYGFKGLLLMDERGVIGDIALVPANIDERDAIDDLELTRIMGMLLGDKGFIRPELTVRLAGQGINLQTPKRDNMRKHAAKTFWLG